MNDAVSNAVNSVRLSNTIVSGGEMLDEVLDRKFERREQESQRGNEGSKEQQPDYSAKFADIESRYEELSRSNQELQRKLSHTEGAYQALLASHQSGQRQSTQEQLPQIESNDPDLVAAFNTFEQRLDKKLEHHTKALHEQTLNQARGIEFSRFQQAIQDVAREHPDFLQIYNMDELKRFATPYINDPRYHGHVQWGEEFKKAYKVAKHDALAAELETAKKQLDEYKSKGDRQREQQRRDLKAVPSIGRGSSSGTSAGRSVGDQILSDWKAKNGRKPMPMKGFGRELLSRLRA